MTKPIGLMDSGVGGLTVLHALEQLLPHEDFIYFGDCSQFPYGEKTPEELFDLAIQKIHFLLSKNIKMLVVACHSTTSHCLPALQSQFPLPIIGMITDSLFQLIEDENVAIMATPATVSSEFFKKPFLIPCPQLATKIESLDPDIHFYIRELLAPIKGRPITQLFLCCTHYPFVQHLIEEECDSETEVIDPAPFVARAVKEQLIDPNPSSHTPHHTFYVTGEGSNFFTFLQRHGPKGDFEFYPHTPV